LGHVCRASGVGVEVDAARLPLPPALRRLPASERLRLALAGGEDYELVLAVPPARQAALRAAARRLRVALTDVGAFVAGRGVRISGDPAGPPVGFDHFRR